MAAARVVAGYDGSAESRLAIRWAAAVAHRRGLALRVVSATGIDPTSPAAYGAGPVVGAAERARARAKEGAALARESAPIDVEPVGIERGAVAAMVRESERADLLVIGSRGRGRLRGVLLGSAAFATAMHSACPVAVVRGSIRPLPSPDHPIVVGTDGSAGSAAAVREAARLASETEARLMIVVAYNAPSNSPWLAAHYPGDLAEGEGDNVWSRRAFDSDRDGTSADRRRRRAADIARRAAEDVAELYPGVDIELLVISGRPERAIVEAAADASLIVVGARGRGDFASLLLGSVSRDVIEHADCAVYVVR